MTKKSKSKPMSKTKRIVWFIIIAIIISLISYKIYHDNFVYETRSSTFLYDKNSAIYNFSKEETKEILDTFKIVVPENEKNVLIRCFAKSEKSTSNAHYYLEFDGINSYGDFENNNTHLKEYKSGFNVYEINRVKKYYLGLLVFYFVDGKIITDEYQTNISKLYNKLYTRPK